VRFSTRSTRTAGLVATAALAMVPATALADGGLSPEGTKSQPANNTAHAKLVHGKAIAPESAPQRVKRVIAAANKIRNKPYVYGGGHGSWNDNGYDCSGSVSYALHGGGLLSAPLDSSGLARWKRPGKGSWISVYGNSGHAYMIVAGLRFDTSMTPGNGPGWSKSLRSTSGSFAVRHAGSL
jgi:cell wall-associated NlpC family hydrolase